MMQKSEIKWARAEEFFERISSDSKKFKKINLGIKENKDFFPLKEAIGSGHHGTWTGYFVTRQNSKKKMKNVGIIMRKVKAFLAQNFYQKIFVLKNLLLKGDYLVSVLTHHDAITGTSVEAVVKDYHDGIANYKFLLMEDLKEEIFNELFGDGVKKAKFEISGFQENYLVDISSTYKSLLENKIILKSFLPTKTTLISLEISQFQNFNLKGKNNKIYEGIKICDRLKIEDKCRLEFMLKLPSFSLNSYELIPKRISDEYLLTKSDPKVVLNIDYKFWVVEILNESLMIRIDEEKIVEISWMIYTTLDPNKQTPGHYIMNLGKIKEKAPLKLSMKDFSFLELPDKYIVKVYSQNKELTSEFVIQKTYKKKFKIEAVHKMSQDFSTNMLRSSQFYELFVRYDTGIESGKKFKTDLNGLRMMEREFEVQDKYPSKSDEIASYIFPVTSIAYSANKTSEFGVVIDRPTAATMRQDGALDIWINRASHYVDDRGNNEKIKENEKLNIRQFLYIQKKTKIKDLMETMRKKILEEELSPLTFLMSREKSNNYKNAEFKNFENISCFEEEFNELVKVSYDFAPLAGPNQILITFTNFNENRSIIIDNLKEKLELCIGGKKLEDLEEVMINNSMMDNGKRDFLSFELGPMQFKVFKIKLK